VVTALVLARSGAENPSRQLSAEQAKEFMSRYATLSSGGADVSAKLYGRGGYGVQWDDDGGPAYLIVRNGVAAVYHRSGVPTLFSDTVGLSEFVRGCLREELEQLNRSTTDPPPRSEK